MKTYFTKVETERLTNEAHFEHYEAQMKVIDEHIASMPELQNPFDKMEVAYGDEEGSLDVMRKSHYTAAIVTQEGLRDRTYRCLSQHIQADLLHPEAARREAAEQVNRARERYGNLPEKSYDAETAAIDDMVREFDASCKPQLQTLGLDILATTLSTQNARFKELVQLRYKEVSQRPTLKMPEARRRMDTTFRAFTDYVDALITAAVINGTYHGRYDALIAEMNAVSKHYKDLIARGNHHGGKLEEGEE